MRVDGIKRTVLIVLVLILCISVINISYASGKTPGKVKNLKASEITVNSVKLSWNSASNAKKYKVYAKIGSKGKYRLVKTVSERTVTVNAKKGTHYYKVRAVNGTKKGKYSKQVKIVIKKNWKHPYSGNYKKSVTDDYLYTKMDSATETQFDNAFRILFAGDLILLEDQVRNGYNGEGYSFDDCFEYTRRYISDANLSIGIFEGPMAGEDRGYSSSNYDDGKKLALNFPDEWADAVKNAGFDLVSTANNHALDKGVSGLERTIDVLNEKGLDYTGTYKDDNDKGENSVKLIEKEGFRIAVLSYVSAINGQSIDNLIKGNISYVTSEIVSSDSKYFSKVKASVKSDFAKAKAMNPDLIIVLPHWGVQFASKPNNMQLEWEKIFKEYGADIILGDHTHSVQQVYLNSGKFTLYSPGNYANIYRNNNGDYSALTEVYIDRESKKIIGGSVIPMWTNSTIDGNYRAIPIYDILSDSGLRKTFTTYDLERVKAAQNHITSTMLGVTVPYTSLQERYYFDMKGYLRTETESLEITEEMKEGPMYAALTGAETVCFIGDSVTEGTRNGGVPWYEPLSDLVNGKSICCGWGSSTVKTILKDHMKDIYKEEADLYVIAIGTNDIRYRKSSKCCMTKEEYIRKLDELKSKILADNPNAEFVFIAPWTSTDGDKQSKLSYEKKMAMNNEYSEALKQWTEISGDTYIDPNEYINDRLKKYANSIYLMDAIHPNATKGVELYSEAVMKYQGEYFE